MADPDLREYVEALLAEHQRATEMAERERENAARALSTEKRTAAQTAEREREKATRSLWLTPAAVSPARGQPRPEDQSWTPR